MRRAAPLMLVVVGVLVAAPALGVAVPWIADTGPGATSLVAGVLAVAGLASVAIGAVGLVRSFRGWRRVPVALALVPVVVAGLYVLAIPVAATNVPPDDPVTLADRPDRARDVTFPATDGVRLSGTYLPGGDRGALVVVPGAGSTRAGAWPQAGALHDAGFAVLVVDPRGHGDSGGNAMDFGWYGDEDLGGAVDWLASRPGVEDGRIGVVGFSMGGEQALGAAAAEPRIAAVVAEGATGRSADDRWWLPDAYGVPGRIQVVLDRAMYGVADLLVDRGPPTPLREAVAGASPRPALIVAGGEVADEVEVAERLRAAAPEQVQVWVVRGSGHTAGYREDPAGWIERVGAFLDEALR